MLCYDRFFQIFLDGKTYLTEAVSACKTFGPLCNSAYKDGHWDLTNPTEGPGAGFLEAPVFTSSVPFLLAQFKSLEHSLSSSMTS